MVLLLCKAKTEPNFRVGSFLLKKNRGQMLMWLISNQFYKIHHKSQQILDCIHQFTFLVTCFTANWPH